MESEGTANFYRLINRNSKGSRSTVALVEKGKRLTDPQEQCRGFASYYEDLAIPKDSSSFDDDYKSRVSADLHLIRQVAGDSSEAVPLIEADEVERAIKKLHRKKAADEYGLVSEHLKTAGSSVFDPLALIFSEILQMKHIPEQFKSGILHPIHKKGKDASLHLSRSLFLNYKLQRHHGYVTHREGFWTRHPWESGVLSSNSTVLASIWILKRALPSYGSSGHLGNYSGIIRDQSSTVSKFLGHTESFRHSLSRIVEVQNSSTKV